MFQPRAELFIDLSGSEEGPVRGKGKGTDRQSEEEVFHGRVAGNSDIRWRLSRTPRRREKFHGQSLQLRVDQPRHLLQVASADAQAACRRETTSAPNSRCGFRLPVAARRLCGPEVEQRGGNGGSAEIDGYGEPFRRFQRDAPGGRRLRRCSGKTAPFSRQGRETVRRQRGERAIRSPPEVCGSNSGRRSSPEHGRRSRVPGIMVPVAVTAGRDQAVLDQRRQPRSMTGTRSS